MLQFSEFVWTPCFSVWDVFNNFLLIDATDKSKISSDQKHFFIALSLYPLSFFANTPFNKTNLASNESDWKHRNLPGSTDLLKEPNIVGVVVVGEVDDPLVEVTENPAESCSAARHSTRVELTFLIPDDILF